MPLKKSRTNFLAKASTRRSSAGCIGTSAITFFIVAPCLASIARFLALLSALHAYFREWHHWVGAFECIKNPLSPVLIELFHPAPAAFFFKRV